MIARISVVGATLALAAFALEAQAPTDTLAKSPSDSVAKAAADSAKALRGPTVLWQPTGASYTFGEGTDQRTVEQLAMPLAMIFPIHRRFNMDLTTAAAYTRVVAGDSTVSEIWGATDTQIRANINILLDRLVLTLGVNAPSGQYYVDSAKLEAAGRIGNDFLFFPISSMGNGPAGTAGLATAMQLAGFNLGLGGSLRKSMEFVPIGSGTEEFRYQPADETRIQLTAERALWLGSTASLGVTFASFGEEMVNNTTYSTGDRVITTAAWSVPVWRASLVLSLWNLARGEGQQLGGDAPKENIRNFAAAINLPVWRLAFQPAIESRRWQVDGSRAGELLNYGISIVIPAGRSTIVQPSFTTSSGTLYSETGTSSLAIGGWQGSLLIRRR